MGSATGDGLTRPTPPSFGKSPWVWVAVALGVVGVGLVMTVFFLSDPSARETLYGVGFVSLVLAAVAGVVGSVRATGERLAVLPRTVMGWWALGLLGGGFLLTVVPGMVDATGGFVNRLLTGGVLLGFLAMLLSGVLGIGAVLTRGERSLLVIVLSLVFGMFPVFFVLGELAVPH